MGKRKSVKKSHLKLTGDAYREAVLSEGESRDCTVRALSAACDVPYWEAHRWLAKRGRKMKAGAPVQSIIGMDGKVVFGHRFGKRIHPSRTVAKFVRTHPTGTFYCCTNSHAFVVKDGKAIGQRVDGSIIQYYWRVTKVERKEPEVLVDNKMLPTFEPMKVKPERSIFDVHKERIRQQNAKMPEPMRAIMNPEKIVAKEYRNERGMEYIEAQADRDAEDYERWEDRGRKN